jgi:hypothetical protein
MKSLIKSHFFSQSVRGKLEIFIQIEEERRRPCKMRTPVR